MAKVLITGGNGLIGSRLNEKLHEKGYTTSFLSRKKRENSFVWNIKNMSIDQEAFEGVDYIVHLAGESIAGKRWSTQQKKQIFDSRVNSSRLIVAAIKKAKTKPKALISASAVGYYGFAEKSKVFQETDPASTDFLGNVCSNWEAEVNKAKKENIRTANIRTGVVLSAKGGALSKINIFIKKGFGSGFGTGKQYMPWIHIDDLCDIYIKAIEDDKMEGAFNAVAPDHRTNIEFVQLLAKEQHKRIRLPNVPAFVLKLMLGEMSQVLLKGNKVSSKKVETIGFQFKFPDLKNALKDLLSS